MLIWANGHGTRQTCGTDKFGFPTRHRTNKQIHFSFPTGDIVKAVVTSGKKIGEYVGRVCVVKVVVSISLPHQEELLELAIDSAFQYIKRMVILMGSKGCRQALRVAESHSTRSAARWINPPTVAFPPPTRSLRGFHATWCFR